MSINTDHAPNFVFVNNQNSSHSSREEILRANCEKTIDEIVKAKNEAQKNKISAVTAVSLLAQKYVQSHSLATLSQLERALRVKERIAIRLNQDEKYGIYFFASNQIIEGTFNTHLKSNVKKATYHLRVAIGGQDWAMQERIKHVPNAQLNYERLDDTGLLTTVVDQMDEVLLNVHNSKSGSWDLNIDGIQFFLKKMEKVSKEIDEKVLDLITTFYTSDKSLEELSAWHRSSKATIEWLTMIVDTKFQFTSGAAQQVKKKASEGIKILYPISDVISKKFQNEASYVEPLKLMAETLNNLDKKLDPYDLSVFSTIVTFCDDCLKISDIHTKDKELELLIKELHILANKHRHAWAGLPNIGNSCYINAGLQLLKTMKIDYNYIQAHLKRKVGKTDEGEIVIESEEDYQGRHSLIAALASIKTFSQPDIELSLKELRTVLFESRVSPEFNLIDLDRICQQHDSAAFIDAVLCSAGLTIGVVSRRTFKHEGTDRLWISREEPLTFLRLPVMEGISLEKILKTELYDKTNTELTWRPTILGRPIAPCAYQESIIIKHFPDTLFIQVNRFNSTGDKIEHPIAIENSESIDLSHLSDPLDPQNVTYRITAFECHIGNNSSAGHYVTYRKETDNNWYKFDDNFVSFVKPVDIKEYIKTAYLFALDKI